MRVLGSVCLIVLIANWKLSSKVNPSSKLAFVSDLIAGMDPWTNPVPDAFYIFAGRISLNSLFLKQLPLSVRMVRGVQLSEQKFVIFTKLCGWKFAKAIYGY